MKMLQKHLKLIAVAGLVGLVYLGWPASPDIEQQPDETPQHFAYRYQLKQADAYLYNTKFIGQRWRGTRILNTLAEKAPSPYNINALTTLFEYHRFHGLHRTEWLNRSWHEPLPRGYVENAADAAIRLAEIAPEKAADLLAEFIIYPVTVPALPKEAIELVRKAAEKGTTQAIKAMRVYCTDDRFWHPCSSEETEKWKKRDAEATIESTRQTVNETPSEPSSTPSNESE